MKSITYIASFIVFFVVLYFQQISILGFDFTRVWKLPVLLFLLLVIILKSRGISQISFSAFCFALKNVVYRWVSFTYLLSDLLETIKFCVIPIFTESFRIFFRNKSEALFRLSITLAVFIILSSVPFLCGFLEEIANPGDLSMSQYGDENTSRLIGVFGTPHDASTSFACSVLLLILYIKRLKPLLKRILFSIILAVGILALYLTYIRTGWLMFFCGSTYIVFSNKRFVPFAKHVIVMLLFLIPIAYMYQNSQFLRNRVKNELVWRREHPDLDLMSSGRITFWKTAVSNLIESEPIDIIFGLGREKSKDLTDEKTARGRKMAHSGYFDIFQMSGLLGTLLYMVFLFQFLIVIRRSRGSPYQKELITMFIAYLASMSVQGGHFFWEYIFLSMYLALALIYIEDKIANNLESQEAHYLVA